MSHELVTSRVLLDEPALRALFESLKTPGVEVTQDPRALHPDDIKTLQKWTREDRRCGSMQTVDGWPCRRHPGVMFTVCKMHGARAPMTQAKGERLLAAAREPAIEWLLNAIENAQRDTCKECGFPKHSLKELKRLDLLAFKLLDRLGQGPRSTLKVERADAQPLGFDIEQLTEYEGRELDAILETMEAFKQRVRARLVSSELKVVEGVVVVPAHQEGQAHGQAPQLQAPGQAPGAPDSGDSAPDAAIPGQEGDEPA